MDTSDDGSCSDCKIELIKQRWTQLLLNWLNKCIHPQKEVHSLNPRSLVEVINRYKQDICYNDMDRAMLCTDDLEPFLTYKYPILRLRYFFDEIDVPRKMYIMTSVLLFHCCVSSQMGVVVGDICKKLDNDEQEMVLRFCEKLTEMETTLNNVDSAIRAACESVSKYIQKSRLKLYKPKNPIINTESYVIPSDSTITGTTSDLMHPKKVPTLKFKSSVTVMPSCITDTSSKTSLQPASSKSSDSMVYRTKLDDNADGVITDSNEISVYNVESKPLTEGREDKVRKFKIFDDDIEIRPPCKANCACTKCSVTGPSCRLSGSTVDCDDPKSDNEQYIMHTKFDDILELERRRLSTKSCCFGVGMVLLLIIIIVLILVDYLKKQDSSTHANGKGEEKLMEPDRVIDFVK